jgi:hypothetical protein
MHLTNEYYKLVTETPSFKAVPVVSPARLASLLG